jgi:Tfp pilus assembly protein PilW
MRDSEDGMSMVELIVYLALSTLVLTILVSFFITSYRSQAATRERDLATGSAQLISSSLTTGLRNADQAVAVGGNRLIARTATGSTGWQCQEWKLTSGDLSYRTRAANTAGTWSAWTSLRPDAGNTVVVADGSGGTQPFNPASTTLVSGGRLQFGFTVTVGQSSVTVAGAETLRAKGSETYTCPT